MEDVYYFEVETECKQVLTSQMFIPNEHFTIDMWQDELIKNGFINKNVLVSREQDEIKLGYAIEKLKVNSIMIKKLRR